MKPSISAWWVILHQHISGEIPAKLLEADPSGTSAESLPALASPVPWKFGETCVFQGLQANVLLDKVRFTSCFV